MFLHPSKCHELCVRSWSNKDDQAKVPISKDFTVEQVIRYVNQLLLFNTIKCYALGSRERVHFMLPGCGG